MILFLIFDHCQLNSLLNHLIQTKAYLNFLFFNRLQHILQLLEAYKYQIINPWIERVEHLVSAQHGL